MKIATTTGDFKRFCKNDSERIEELYRAGFRYIDLSMYDFTPQSPYMSENWRDEVEKIRKTAERLGMKFVQAHSQGGNPLSEDKSHTDFLLAATVRSIEICEFLGIKNTVVHNGYMPKISKDEWFERNKAFYSELFPVMERCGVNVLCENSTKANMRDMYFINSGRDMLEFIRYVDHPQIHACWDTGHANCEGGQYDDIITLGKELYAIHYNDNRGFSDEHILPFFGTLNHDEVMTALTDIGFDGYFTLECDSSLRFSDCWLGGRRKFEKSSHLAEPQLFMQRKIERLAYEAAEYILKGYSMLEQ